MIHLARGPIAFENEQTGDGRVISPGAIEWAELPLPFAILSSGDQHVDLVDGAPQIGNVDQVWRDGDAIWAEVSIDDENPDGAELVRRMTAGSASHGHRQGVSIDPDDWKVEVWADDGEDDELLMVASGRGPVLVAAAGDPDAGDDPDGRVLVMEDSVGDVLQRMTHLRIRGLTAVAIPAFAGAFIELVEAETEQPEDGAVPVMAAASALTAAVFAVPEPDIGATGQTDIYGMPVEELFVEQPDGRLAVPFTITADRRIFGHAARWGQCHIGYADACVTAPTSPSGYARFHHGQTRCGDGTVVATGPLTMGCDHAAAHLRAPEAIDHYAHQGLAFADVRATDGALGVWVSGVLRPDVTDDQIALIESSSLSGDWRGFGDDLDMIGCSLVNVPGFGIAREPVTASALTASSWFEDGHQQSLIAAGVVHRCSDCQRREQDAGEVLSLLRTIELRTRQFRSGAAQHALGRIRRQ